MKLIGGFTLAVIAALVVGWMYGYHTGQPAPTPIQAKASPCSPSVSEQLQGYATEDAAGNATLRIHVSYNNLTGGRSKMTMRKGGETRYVLMGETKGALVRCLVSQDYFAAVQENSFVNLPPDKCEEIKP